MVSSTGNRVRGYHGSMVSVFKKQEYSRSIYRRKSLYNERTWHDMIVELLSRYLVLYNYIYIAIS